jgi:hypothetical protein
MTVDQREQTETEDHLRHQIEAYHEAALVFAAVKLGLPDRMGDGRWAVDELAQTLDLSPPHLKRFLRGLCTLGLCEEHSDGTFALTPTGHSLRLGSPSPLRAKAMIVVEQYWRPWAELARSLETGKPAFEHVFGVKVQNWRRDNYAQGAVFESYLAKETFAHGADILEALDLSGAGTVADVGGGHGGLIATVLHARPDIAGALFDQEQTIAAAGPFLDSVGVGGRVQLIGGDILAEIPVRADLYLLKCVLQQWNDADALAILKNCRKAMPPTARLVIIERLMREHAADDPAAVMLDLHMMAITGGRARTIAEIEDLLSPAGLQLASVTSTHSGLSIIEATPEP